MNSIVLSNCKNLKSVENLIGVRRIENKLRFYRCDSLLSLNGLDSIRFISEFSMSSSHIDDISALKNLEKVECFKSSWTHGFKSFESLSSLKEIGNLEVSKGDFESLFPHGQLDSLRSLKLQQVRHLKRITGLERIKAMDFLIIRDDHLESIDGFDSLEMVYPSSSKSSNFSSQLTIDGSNAKSTFFPNLRKVHSLEFRLSSLKGEIDFNKLDSIDRLTIYSTGLKNLDIFNDSIHVNIASISHNIHLEECSSTWLCNLLASEKQFDFTKNSIDCHSLSDLAINCGFDIRCPSESIVIENHLHLVRYLEKYETCEVLPEDLEIHMTNLSGNTKLDSLRSLGGTLKIYGHDGIGILPKLEEIEEAEFIDLKEDFQSYFHFENLESLTIKESSELEFLHLTIPHISEFSFYSNSNINVLSFDESVDILYTFNIASNNDLKYIIGPNKFTESHAFRVRNNEALESIFGFANTTVLPNGLIIVSQNPNLNTCHVPPLCNITTQMTDIQLNGNLCSDIDTINLVCDGLLTDIKSVSISSLDKTIAFPNPTIGSIYFKDQNHNEKSLSGKVFDMRGVLHKQFSNSSEVSIEDLHSGIFIIKTSDGDVFKIHKL